MSASVSFKELVNLAIGSPEVGAVNFNALYTLLHGMLEHLQLGDVRRALSQEEKEFLQPGLILGSKANEATEKSPSLFRQVQDKITRMESKLMELDSLPSSNSLLQASQSQNKPIQEMWQLMQLKKKVEMNEDGVNKAMSVFQELLSTFNSLKQTSDHIQGDLSKLNDTVKMMDLNAIQQRLLDLERRNQDKPTLADQLESLQKKILSYPESTDLATWSSLHDSLTVEASNNMLSTDAKQKNAKGILRNLGKLPGRHEELAERVHSIEEELKQLGREISNVGIPDNLLQQLQSLRRDVDRIFSENSKGKDEMKTLQNALHQLNMALQKLDSKTAKLEADLSETATLQGQIYELEKKKLDREELTLELSTKADKRALDTKVGHSQLEAAVSEVNGVLDDLIKKLDAQDSEWRTMLEKLLASLEAKLSRSDLDTINRDLEELRHILKKYMESRQAFEPDGAAGFRKKLFETVKCISCDRPITVATGPHMVTVRTASLTPRNRPSTADISRERSIGDPLQVTDSDFQYSESQRPHTACPHYKRMSRTQHLTTVYPYADYGQSVYRNSEFDLIGIDGMMYKGRIDKSFGNQTSEKDPSVVMTPLPPSRIERARSATQQRSLSTPVNRESSSADDGIMHLL
ncbi:Hypothetical predicted protein [Pelobates cultripes]|uniref:DUF4795 domain-containing protein n=1 Tax=Pelobates cultripes TaxID=61616 RepID=A0AAD1WJC9_PELCU|nr:Hypothetical predicted protein [Pelobates cultripes]